jgi:hypothetical protein
MASAAGRIGPRGAGLRDSRDVKSDTDLGLLLAELSPRQRPGQYVFVVADEAKPVADRAVLASVLEPEGLSLVLTRHDAERAGLPYDFVAGWITLQVRSALKAVGLTAAVAAALGEARISCNVIAGYHHDHLLVPYPRVGEAIDILHQLSASDLPPGANPRAGAG